MSSCARPTSDKFMLQIMTLIVHDQWQALGAEFANIEETKFRQFLKGFIRSLDKRKCNHSHLDTEETVENPQRENQEESNHSHASQNVSTEDQDEPLDDVEKDKNYEVEEDYSDSDWSSSSASEGDVEEDDQLGGLNDNPEPPSERNTQSQHETPAKRRKIGLRNLTNRGRYSIVDTPTPEDPLAGCPGLGVRDNVIDSILDFEQDRQLKFKVNFKHYGPRWISAQTTLNLEPRSVLESYLRQLAREQTHTWRRLVQKNQFLKELCQEKRIHS